MLRREHQERPAVKRVRASREYADLLFVIVDLEIDFRAFAFSDPVSLEQFDSFRPIEAFELIDQSFRVSSDAQHPLPHWPANHRKPANLTFPIDNFFVGQDGAEFRAPIHWHFRYVSEPHAVRIFAAIS